MRQAAPRLRQPGMVRNPVGHLQAEELPERKRIRAAPLDPALAVDPLEIPHHVHPKVPTRRHRGCAHGLGVERAAGFFHEAVEPGSEQHLLQAVVEHVARRARHLGPHHHQLALTIALPTHRHSQTPVQSPSTIDSDQPDFVNGLLAYDVLEAANRGVRVRLLLDDINDFGRDPAYLALDDHPNIEVRMFNPSRARKGRLRRGLEMAMRPLSLTRRMHNKAWIADGVLAIVGGRNVGDGYFDAAQASNFRDLDLLMVGDAVDQAAGIFDQYWNSSVVIPIKTLSKQAGADQAAVRQRLVDQARSESSRLYLDHVLTRSSLALAL